MKERGATAACGKEDMRGSAEYKRLRAIAEALLEEHSPLVFQQNHDGAEHCKCELAQAYRKADAAAWVERRKPKEANRAESSEEMIRELVEWIKKYGGHGVESGVSCCDFYNNKPCNCGLESLLARNQKEKA